MFPILGGLLGDHDFSAQLTDDCVEVRCYRCACVVKVWNRDYPFKFVNCIKIRGTQKFNSELERKKKEYKFAFECFPKSEKITLITELLREHYSSLINRSDDFYCCYLGVCDVKDSRRLVGSAFHNSKLQLLFIGNPLNKAIFS